MYSGGTRMVCEKCGKEHDGSFGSGRFCSLKCAHSRTWTGEHNLARSEKLKGRRVGGAIPDPSSKEIRTCKCGVQFEVYKHGNRKFCSKACSTQHKDYSNCGGVRLGSGRSKSGWYKGIYCGSTYELAWVIYHLDHGISFERNNEGFDYIFNGVKHKYYPDFKLGSGNYVEVKGYLQKQDLAKWKMFPHNLQVLTKEKLKPIFQYVTSKHGSRLYELYEGIANPKQNPCRVCGEPSRNIYCSRRCAMLGNKKRSSKKTRTDINTVYREYYHINKDRINARRRELYNLKKL